VVKSPVTTNSDVSHKLGRQAEFHDVKLGLTSEFVTGLWTLKKKSPHVTVYTIFIFSLSFFPFLFLPFFSRSLP
jgi:hypothetical protein